MTFETDWDRFMFMIGIDIENALAVKAPVDTGDLKGSVNHQVNGNVITISMAEQGLWTEFGTPPHIIRPVDAKALHFKTGGNEVFAKVVHHPGTRPNPWIRPVFKHQLPKLIQKNMSKVFS